MGKKACDPAIEVGLIIMHIYYRLQYSGADLRQLKEFQLDCLKTGEVVRDHYNGKYRATLATNITSTPTASHCSCSILYSKNLRCFTKEE